MKYFLLLFSAFLFTACLNEPDIEPYDDTADLAYLEEYAQRDDVTMTESGLLYRVIEEGEGESPASDNFTFVKYDGTTVDGQEQLSSGDDLGIFLPNDFQNFTGIAEAILLMNTGAIYEAVLPTELATGNGKVYTFELELDSFLGDPDEFLTENAEQDNITITDSGLQYRIIEQGEGDAPNPENTVRVNYKGSYVNGYIFDQTTDEPAEFLLGGLIPGFTEGVQLINEGGTIEFFVPANIGYGNNPPSGIIPGAVLVFEVELLQIL